MRIFKRAALSVVRAPVTATHVTVMTRFSLVHQHVMSSCCNPRGNHCHHIYAGLSDTDAAGLMGDGCGRAVNQGCLFAVWYSLSLVINLYDVTLLLLSNVSLC